MKRTTYECKKCGKACNGGGISFIATEAKDVISIVLSNDMDRLPEHACTEAHMVEILAGLVRKLKSGEEQPSRPAAEEAA